MITVRCAPYYSKISTNDGGFYAAKPTWGSLQVGSDEVLERALLVYGSK